MRKISILILTTLFIILMSGCGDDTTQPSKQDDTVECEELKNCVESLPVITGESVVENVYYDNDWTNKFVHMLNATDLEDGDITNDIFVVSVEEFDFSEEGSYEVVFGVFDSDGNYTEFIKTVNVVYNHFGYPSGTYDLSNASNDIRRQFMIASEKFLLENMAGGIPLVSEGVPYVYSDRINLALDHYVEGLGFGLQYSELTKDDSNVIMPNGLPGNEGEYTFRTITEMIQLESIMSKEYVYYDISNDIYSALYRYVPSDNKNGYEIINDLAIGDPIAVDSNGNILRATTSKIWRVELKDDLRWYFHPDTDESFLNTNSNITIDANDFIDTYKLAVDSEIYSYLIHEPVYNLPSILKNLFDVIGDTKPFSDLGVTALENAEGEDLIIEFEFQNNVSMDEVKDLLSKRLGTPVHTDYYNYVIENNVNTDYGMNVETIAYTGPYYIDEFTDGIYYLKRNPNYKENDLFHFTGKIYYSFTIQYEELTELGSEYFDFSFKKLSNDKEQYENSNTLLHPNGDVVRLALNEFGTNEEMKKYYPNSEYEPEPILANANFKKALYYGVDRELFLEAYGENSESYLYFIPDNYMLGNELYRYHEDTMVLNNLYQLDSMEKNREQALEYFLLAIEELIEEGVYTQGTESDPNIIEITIDYYDGYSHHAEAIKASLDNLFKDNQNQISVEFIIQGHNILDDNSFYHGEYDLMFQITPYYRNSPLMLYRQSESYLNSNLGVDTSVANIPVVYTDSYGVEYHEYWSFDAISLALNGSVDLLNGEIFELPKPTINIVSPTSFEVDINFSLFEHYEVQVLLFEQDENFLFTRVEEFETVYFTGNTVYYSGLKPFYSIPNFDKGGEYMVEVRYFPLTGDLSKVVTTYEHVYLESTLEHVYDNFSSKGIDITIVLNPNHKDTIERIELYHMPQGTDEIDFIKVIEINDFVIKETDLIRNERYLIKIIYESGVVDYIEEYSK